MSETFAEWEKRKHSERLEREKQRAETFAAMSEVHRANMLTAIELMRELPTTVQGLVAALGYLPSIKVGIDGITVVGREG